MAGNTGHAREKRTTFATPVATRVSERPKEVDGSGKGRESYNTLSLTGRDWRGRQAKHTSLKPRDHREI